LHALDDMQRCDIEPDAISYNTEIGTCENCVRPEQALQLLVEMNQRGLKPNVITNISVLGVPLSMKKARGGLTFNWIGYELSTKKFSIGISEYRAMWLMA
jgi:hypothetical protein